MRLEQLSAYILHARPYRETSMLLECFTRSHGRIGAVARGVRRPCGRAARASFELFQHLRLDLIVKGELATLVAVEAEGGFVRLAASAGLAGLYLNELVVRLTGRQDPHPGLFDAYTRTLGRLSGGERLAWHLRRFERDLLHSIGYTLPLAHDADTGEPLQPDAWYEYRAEHGLVRSTQARAATVRGADLLAFAHDAEPTLDAQPPLRRMMREVLRFHMGGRELAAWRLLSGLPR